MALSEQKILFSVTFKSLVPVFEVCWHNNVLRDGVVIATTPHRCTYAESEKDKFIAEVDGAAGYLIAAGWQ